jgi:hypothetical protein
VKTERVVLELYQLTEDDVMTIMLDNDEVIKMKPNITIYREISKVMYLMTYDKELEKKRQKYINDAINFFKSYNIGINSIIHTDWLYNDLITLANMLIVVKKDLIINDDLKKKINRVIESKETKLPTPTSNENTLFMPVLRLTGLYYSANPTDKKYCGKFYYVETESSVYLNLGRCFVFGSKVEAYTQLQIYRDSKLGNKKKQDIITEKETEMAKMLLEEKTKTKIKGLIDAWNIAIKKSELYSPI